MQPFAPNQFLEQAFEAQNAGFSQIIGVLSQEAERLRRQKMMQDQASMEYNMRVNLGKIEFDQQMKIVDKQIKGQKDIANIREQGDITVQAMKRGTDLGKAVKDGVDQINSSILSNLNGLVSAGLNIRELYGSPEIDPVTGVITFDGMLPSEKATDVIARLGKAESNIQAWQKAYADGKLSQQDKTRYEAFQMNFKSGAIPLSELENYEVLKTHLPELPENAKPHNEMVSNMSAAFRKVFPAGPITLVNKDWFSSYKNEEKKTAREMSLTDMLAYTESNYGVQPSSTVGDQPLFGEFSGSDFADNLRRLAMDFATLTGKDPKEVLNNYTVNDAWDGTDYRDMFVPFSKPTTQSNTSAERSRTARASLGSGG